MNKNEFLSQLRKKLDVLSQDEIDELITEYSEHIDNKLHEGKTEEQAVSDFGDLGELSRNILQAYKLNDNFTSKPKINSFLHIDENTSKKLIRSFEQFYAKISLSEVFKFLILVILSFGLVAILKFPFMLFKSISLWFMEIIFGYKFVDYIDGIWSFVVNAAYYLSSILLIISVVHFGQQRYLQITHQSQSLKKKSNETVNEDINTQTVSNIVEESEKVEEVVNHESFSVKSNKQRNGFSNFIHQTVNLFYLCILWSLRLLILAVLFPMIVALIFGLFIWGMLVFLVITQVPIIGIMFTTGMGLIFAACMIIVIFAYTFNIKLKTWRYSRIFTVITITLILGGFGSIWSLNEVSQFEWINEDISDYIEYEYNLNDFENIDMTNTWVSVEIDNTLDEQVIISVSPEIDNNGKVLSKVDQTLFITISSYSEVEEINEFRNRIVEQFNALKEGKLIFQHNTDTNQVIIRVNEKNLQLLENRLEFN